MRAMRMPPGRRGFIILFGSRTVLSNRAEPPVEARCPNCGRVTRIVPKSYRTWFTVFFIPVFPISGAKPVAECSSCGAMFEADPEQLRRAGAMDDGRRYQAAIALYNALREHPADSAALLQLMHLYASLDEPHEAIKAAEQFPQALNNSAQCRAAYEQLKREMDAAR
jgi:hypothetical protein